MPWQPQTLDEVPSLGWEVLDWMTAHLPSPADSSQPLVLTDEQALTIVEWYALDESGRFLYRRGCSRRSKGRGKSPVEAAKAIAEVCGPVRFRGLGRAGSAGRPSVGDMRRSSAVGADRGGVGGSDRQHLRCAV